MRRFTVGILTAFAALIASSPLAAAPPVAASTNLLVNPGFSSGFSGWWFQAMAPAEAVSAVVGDTDPELRVDVTASGSPWDVYIVQHRVAVTDKTYVFEVAARASIPGRQISLLVVDVDGETIYGRRSFSIDGETALNSIRFDVPAITEVDCFVAFGGRSGSVWCDDLSLRVAPDDLSIVGDILPR